MTAGFITHRALTAVVALLAAALALQAVWVAWSGPWSMNYGRNMLLGAALVITLITQPFYNPAYPTQRKRIIGTVLDVILVGAVVVACIRFTQVEHLQETSFYIFSQFDTWTAVAGTIALLEATRRLFGLPIVIIATLAMVYCLYGNVLPGFLNHSGVDLSRTMQNVWYGFQGVFGMPTGVVIRVVMVFIVFGVLLEETGASDALIRTSVALTGRSRGGPAHAAVVASALFGSMSGSVTANVVGSGTFTIPMIKRRGFSPATAGGIEAAASTGGQIVPPVMGAAAFLMADLTGELYTTIALAALVPALFYYGALFAGISVQAGKLGIEPIPASERVRLTRRDYVHSLQFVLPILAIVAVLVTGRSPALAGFVAVASAAVLGLFRKQNRENPRLYWDALVRGGKACASILVAVGCIGVILGVLNLTGLGLSFASVISSFSETWLFGSLVVTAFACLVLGMGMPTLPAYLIIVLVLGPVMTKLGADTLAVHMFVFYFGVLSAITPPVAIGAFAAAPIAGASPMLTAFVALRLALTGFIIPFIFIYEPSLLLIGPFDPLSFIRVCTALALAIWMLNTGLVGYAGGHIGCASRAFRMLLALGLIIQIPALQYLLIVATLAFLVLPGRFGGKEEIAPVDDTLSTPKGGLL
ncbi:TRAP transporter fused permease subunit [Sulfitobacter sp. 20_GPM-1509m]|uniref:TRAP transporter permease n=1 Tax=Sulfitobacter sp. 20_GPM-1509m TaxID=1380367 RepID=UPI0018CC1C57|nr:TRAP transporter fused permease subunit [Sulfitobacter sp. 20_GPM-1509m]